MHLSTCRTSSRTCPLLELDGRRARFPGKSNDETAAYVPTWKIYPDAILHMWLILRVSEGTELVRTRF
jgi:hypothetical protein